MFKFNFDLEDEGDQTLIPSVQAPKQDTSENDHPAPKATLLEPFAEIPTTALIGALPSLISYSPLPIPLASGRSLHLARRDLFDARFQLISQAGHEKDKADDTNEDEKVYSSALDFIEAPSDLVPGVYEGGLKTWECSLDIVDYLDKILDSQEEQPSSVSGKRVLEIGCGTAVPSVYLLHRLFSQTSASGELTTIHLQDYNRSVLELVTFPNILIAWYMSPAANAYRDSTSDSDSEPDSLPPPDPSQPGELPITSELTEAFLAAVKNLNIEVRFFSGSWDTFDLRKTSGKYDWVLSSETIYRPDSLGPLLSLMYDACLASADEDKDQNRNLEDITESKLNIESKECSYVCLVAAKVLYFGVGGGVNNFVRAIEDPTTYAHVGRKRGKGKVETVREKREGVGRKVMRVVWTR